MISKQTKSLRNITDRNRKLRVGEAMEAIASLALAEASQVRGFDSMSDVDQEALVEQGKLNFTKMMRENPHEFSMHIQNFLESGKKLHADFGRTETRGGRVLIGAGGKVASQLRAVAPTVKEMGLLKQTPSSKATTSGTPLSSPLDSIFQSKKSQEKKAEDQPYGFSEGKFEEDESFRDKILMHVDDLKKELSRGNKISEEDKKLLEKIEKHQKEKKEGKKDPRDFMTPDSAMLYTLGKGVFDLGKALPGLIGKVIENFKTKVDDKQVDDLIEYKSKVEEVGDTSPTSVIEAAVPEGRLAELDKDLIQTLEKESYLTQMTPVNEEIASLPRIQPRDPKTGRFVKDTEAPSYIIPTDEGDPSVGLPHGAPVDDALQEDVKENVETEKSDRSELLELEKKEVELLEKIATNTEGGSGGSGGGIDLPLPLPSIGGPKGPKGGGGWKSAKNLLGRGATALASPLGLGIGAVAATGAAAYMISKGNEEYGERMDTMPEEFKIPSGPGTDKQSSFVKAQMEKSIETQAAWEAKKVEDGGVDLENKEPINTTPMGPQSTPPATPSVVNAPSTTTNITQGASQGRSHYPRNLDNSFVKWRDSRNAYI